MLASPNGQRSEDDQRQVNEQPGKPQPAGRPNLRRMLLVAILVAAAYLLLPQLVGIGDALETLQRLSLPFVAGALVMQTISVLSHAAVVQESLQVFVGTVRFATVLEVALASSFATLLLPSVGLSGLAVRCRYLRERGCSVGATAVAFTIETVGQAAAHAGMVTAAFAHRLAQGRQPPWSSVVLVVGVMLGVATALALLLANPAKRDWRYRILSTVNWARKRRGKATFPESKLEQRLTDLQSSVADVGIAAGARLMLGSIGRNLAAALALYVTLLALDQRLQLSAVVISYSCADVLGGLSSLPAGLLVAETSLAALLNRAGVPLSIAMAAALVFRLVSVWLPRGIGLLAWVDLQRRSNLPFWQ